MRAVNLLPSDQRSASAAKAGKPKKVSSEPSGSAFGAVALLGVLGLAVVAIAAYVLTTNSIKDREATLASTTSAVQAANAKAAVLKPYADFKLVAEARFQTVSQLATQRFDWEQALRDLSKALPRDVRLASLKGSTAGGAAAAAGVPASPTIELSGCTASQTKVARLMARLRAVRGVTRVSLKSSAKAGVVAGAGGTQAGICGKGNKPTFMLNISFERFGVPVATLPAAGAPAVQVAPGTPGAAPAPTPGAAAAGAAAATTPPTAPTEGATTP